MIKEFHSAIKTALFSRTGAGEFTTLVGSRIYDTVGTRGANSPFAVWSLSGVTIVKHFDDNERINGFLQVDLVTDFTAGSLNHLSILEQLADLRNYSAEGASLGSEMSVDRLSLALESIGELIHDDQNILSTTRFLATGTRA